MRREAFETLPDWQVILFYLLIPVTLAVFFIGIAALVVKYRKSPGQTKLDHIGSRLAYVLREAALHRQLGRRDRSARVGHVALLYGFVALAIATGILALNDDILKPLFGIEFWRGTFYLVYSLLADLFGVVLLVGVAIMAVKRLRRPLRLDYARARGDVGTYDRRQYVIGDWAILGMLAFLGVGGFVIEGLRIAITNPDYEIWSPIGWLLGQMLRAVGVVSADPATDAVRQVLWWLHAAVALVLVASIPYTKALHMLVSPVGIGIRDANAGRRLPDVGADAEAIGYRRLTDFSAAHLIQLDACTKCGKCHVACPATASGFPLSPRDLILDLREAANGAYGLRARLGMRPRFSAQEALTSGTISPTALWSCTTCLACVDICPVGIEHVPIVAQFRRALLEDGKLDVLLQDTLKAVAKTGNTFGQPRRTRGRWARELEARLKDAREEAVEYLWFVGDQASFDPRAQAASRALAETFHRAGMDVGILYDAEKTAGCDIRRTGEEGLWLTLAGENSATLQRVTFKRVVTSDPHTYHTLKNEYIPWLGELEVLHHSEVLATLLASGALRPEQPIASAVTYHDPCYLGRYNGIYDAPRQVLAALGADLREMPRNRDNSFCCGAGGGMLWMKEIDRGGMRRPSEQRIEEALALGDVDTFVVACPKDLVMYTEAVKVVGCEDRLRVAELSELVLESLSLPSGAQTGVHRAIAPSPLDPSRG
jgi:Fe-S oxidoreductase